MQRATVALPEVVSGMPSSTRSHGLGRALRVAVVAAALVAGIACCVTLSTGGAGEVELDEPSFGAHSLTPFPVKEVPSTDDLIAIMRGQGHSDVSADQGMLFAGGAGGTIVRRRVHVIDDDASDEARGLWAAAERASKLERVGEKPTESTHDDDLDSTDDAQDEMAAAPVTEAPSMERKAVLVEHPAPIHKVAAGWTDVDEKHKSTKMLAYPQTTKADAKKAHAKAAAAILHKIEQSGKALDAKHAVAAAAAKGAAHVAEKSDKASVKDAQDDYFKHHVSIDDALSRVAKISAEHEARASVAVQKEKMAAVRAKELKEEKAERAKAVAEAARAKAMEAKAVTATKEAQTDEAESRHEAVKAEQQRDLKQREAKKVTQEKQQLARTKAVNAGWTAADAVRARHLAKKFALESEQAPKVRAPARAMSVYAGASLAHREAKLAKAEKDVLTQERDISAQHERKADMAAQATDNAISPYYPTGFIPASKQHDDAHQPDAMPEMIAGIHAAHHEKDGALDKYAQRLKRQSKMESNEEIEETVREDEARKQQQLYKEGHSQASRERLEHAGEKLVIELSSHADVARVMQKVDFSGIAVKDSLKEAIAGDEAHFQAFEQLKWMQECGGSELMLGPVAKQVLAIMEQISTKNASSWLDVEDAQRRADNAKAGLRAAEAGLLSVLESQDRTKAVQLLSKLRDERQQRLAERRANKDTAQDEKDRSQKMSLLLQQRQALKVLSHAEEAQAVSGDERRIQLNKAAFDAQHAVTEQDKVDNAHSSSNYLPDFQSALLATATKPWSLSAQEGVQTLLGDINTKILALEHTEQGRNKRLSALESKVAERMHSLSEVDAADKMLKAELAKEHQTVEELRIAANQQSKVLTRAKRSYQVRLTRDAAELHGAHQVVNRLQKLMDVCTSVLELPPSEGKPWAMAGPTAQTNLATAVKPWVRKPTKSLDTSLPSPALLDMPKHVEHRQVKRSRLQQPRRDEAAHTQPTVAAVSRHPQLQTVAQLEKQLQKLRPLAARAESQAVRRHAPTAHGLSRSRWGRRQAQDRLLQKEIARASADEASMEDSEEQKLSSVAAMIVSDPHEGRR